MTFLGCQDQKQLNFSPSGTGSPDLSACWPPTCEDLASLWLKCSSVCLSLLLAWNTHRTQRAPLAQPQDMHRPFATGPWAWQLLHNPISERRPRASPTPFCGSQKTASPAALWSPANYSALKRGEKLYLCCQLLEKHKEFCRLKKKKKKKKEGMSVCECVCGAGEGGNTQKWVYQDEFDSEQRGENEEKVPGNVTWGIQLHLSVLCL